MNGDATGTSPGPEPNSGASAAETTFCTKVCGSGAAVATAAGALMAAAFTATGAGSSTTDDETGTFDTGTGSAGAVGSTDLADGRVRVDGLHRCGVRHVRLG